MSFKIALKLLKDGQKSPTALTKCKQEVTQILDKLSKNSETPTHDCFCLTLRSLVSHLPDTLKWQRVIFISSSATSSQISTAASFFAN